MDLVFLPADSGWLTIATTESECAAERFSCDFSDQVIGDHVECSDSLGVLTLEGICFHAIPSPTLPRVQVGSVDNHSAIIVWARGCL